MLVQILFILHKNPPLALLLYLNILCLSFGLPRSVTYCRKSSIISTTSTDGVGFPLSVCLLHIYSFLSKELSLQFLIYLFTYPTKTYTCKSHHIFGYIILYQVAMTLRMLFPPTRMPFSIRSTLFGTSKCYSSFRASKELLLQWHFPWNLHTGLVPLSSAPIV